MIGYLMAERLGLIDSIGSAEWNRRVAEGDFYFGLSDVAEEWLAQIAQASAAA
jgi:hypothetical protein